MSKARRPEAADVRLRRLEGVSQGAEVDRNIITRHMTFSLCHLSMTSLLVGKIHALTTRGYPKGRDWFDLLWFAGHKPPLQPNRVLLQNAYNQSVGIGQKDARNWCQYLRNILETMDMKTLSADVRPFLERPEDRTMIHAETLKAAIDALGPPDDPSP